MLRANLLLVLVELAHRVEERRHTLAQHGLHTLVQESLELVATVTRESITHSH